MLGTWFACLYLILDSIIGILRTKFFAEYKICQITPLKKLMFSWYYVFTALTTVGYFDYNNQIEYEKIIVI